MLVARNLRKIARFHLLLAGAIAALLALAACSGTGEPDSPPSANGGNSQASEDDKKNEDLIVDIDRLPSRVCIGQPYEIDIYWVGADLESGNIQWDLSFGNKSFVNQTDFHYMYTGSYTMDNKVTKEPVRARVEIFGYTKKGADPMDLVTLESLVGTAEQDTEFVHCEYTLEISYSGEYTLQIFSISERLDNAGAKGLPIRVDPKTGEVSGEGVLDLSADQSFTQQGITCTIYWAGLVPVVVSGSIGSPGENGTMKLQVERSDQSVIETSTMECRGTKVNLDVPAPAGAVRLDALGLGDLDFSLKGSQIAIPVTSTVGTPGGTGSGTVRITLTPKTGE